MTDVLGRIVERKRREVAERLRGGPVPAGPSTRSLREALARSGARFIMEVKRKSPSGHVSQLGVSEAVKAYARVADAISVLTDGPDFGGSLDDLRTARRLFDGPILAKDFIVDPLQVSEARAAGADAVLVMMSVLDDAGATVVLTEARRYRMDAIVEVHNEVELARAIALGAEIVGINNRDLHSLRTDLAVTERLAAGVPSNVLVIAESGIAARPDVERLAPIVDAFLVGSSLMAAADIHQAARSLVHGPVKLCGLTRPEDVDLAASAGATHAGFIFVPDTPRAVADARELVRTARKGAIKTVGVFRDAATLDVVRMAEKLGLDAVQLHGGEDTLAVRRALPPSVELWAACGVSNAVASCRPGADRTLFDTVGHRGSGGSGQSFDWGVLRGRSDLPAAFLAGGIGPHNARAASRVGAYGLDVGSSVEAVPGIKDPAKVEALLGTLRPAARSDA
jgi:indole-3-glycerol phosphate synthase/phosphoribosylanthranilate isomerase